MPKIIRPNQFDFDPSRRRFVTGLAAGGALMASGINPLHVEAGQSYRHRTGPQTLRGNRFHLTYSPTKVNFTGKERYATAMNGSVPAPVLRWKEGETVTLKVTNNLADDTSIHWHGLILPSAQDGVPHISDGFKGIKPGESFTYRFPLIQNGTYWYHSHSGWQEQTGGYGAIIIDPKDSEPFPADRDYVVVLSDWSDEDPDNIYAKLKKRSHYYNTRERTLSDAMREVKEKGVDGFWGDRAMWNIMRMSDRDISDVTGMTYTFLMNGVTPAEGWMGLFKRGEKVRLRFVNAAAMTFFDVRIPGLKMKVVATDGQNIQPVSVDEFRIGVAETYDVIVEPSSEQAYSVFAQAIDRSGYARGTLTPHPSMTAEVPEMDPAPVLTHGDMGMSHEQHMQYSLDGADNSAHAGMDHSKHAGMDHSKHAGMDHSKPAEMDHSKHAGMDHSKHAGMDHSKPAEMDHSKHAGMDHSKHAGMDHSKPAEIDHSKHAGMDHSKHAGMDHSKPAEIDHSKHAGMDHSAHVTKDHKGHTKMHKPKPAIGSGMAGYGSAQPIVHAPTEVEPYVDMVADGAKYQLDDPGIGLRNNGRRVLTYADIKNLYKTPDPREPSREINLHLTGNMSRYMWSMNGIRFADAEPLHLKYGERVRINLLNDTMMNHPIHLHGMWSDLETGDGAYIPRKHTVVVQPGARISYLVTADAMGGWAYHCHLIFHMPGMFRHVIVS